MTIADGTQVTADDIAQFDNRWMSDADKSARLSTYAWAMVNRQAWMQWGIADESRAMVRMWELTHDPKYVDQLQAIDNILLKGRDDNNTGDDYPGQADLDTWAHNANPMCVKCKPPFTDRERGAVEPAWGSGMYPDFASDGGLNPADPMMSGLYGYALAAFARIVAEDPSLRADKSKHYADDAVKFVNADIQTALAFMPQMNFSSSGDFVEGTLDYPAVFPNAEQCTRAHDYAADHARWFSWDGSRDADKNLAHLLGLIDSSKADNCDHAGVYAGKPLPHNQTMGYMMMLVELWRAIDSDVYRDSNGRSTEADATALLIPRLVAREQRYFANRLQIKNDAAQGERYSWHYEDDVPDPHAEDGHANLDMVYLDLLRQNLDRLNTVAQPAGEPIQMDDAMLRRFANTFLQEYARPSEIDSGGNIRFDVGGRSDTDVGKPADASDSLCDGWVTLAVVDATVYRMCRDVMLRVGAPDADGVRQPYLSIASHAALLANKPFSAPVRNVDLTQGTGVTAGGDPIGWVFAAQDAQDVVFRGSDGYAYELWRTATDKGITNLSTNAGAPRMLGAAAAYEFPVLGTHNVVYLGTDGHLHGLHWTTGGVGDDDLSALSRAPAAASDPAAYVSLSFGVQNVIYAASDGHLHELYWSTGAVAGDDLTDLSGATPPAGNPVAYFNAGVGGQSAIYRGTDGHLHELYWSTGAVGHSDLSVASGAPAPAGDPSAYLTPTGEQHVVYRGVDGHVHDLSWTTGGVGDDDLSYAAGGAPLPTGDPTAYFNALDSSHHVVYLSSNGHLHQLVWTTSAVTHTDLTTVTGAPDSAGKPSAYVFGPDASQHVLYRATDGNLHDLIRTAPIQLRFIQGACACSTH